MLTINKKFVVGLFISIITAAIVYGLRFVFFNYLDYDIFNLENLGINLTCFCSLGGLSYAIKYYLNNTFFMSYCAGSDVSLPATSKPAAVNNSTMQNPNNLSSGSPDNASAGNSSTTKDLSPLEKKINHKKEMIAYYMDQIMECNNQYNDITVQREQKILTNQWNQAEEAKYNNDVTELYAVRRDWDTNITSDTFFINKWEAELQNKGHSMAESSSQSTSTKRTADNSSMSNDYSSSSKRERNN